MSERLLKATENIIETITHSVVNAGVATSQVLAANPVRRYVLIINDSDTIVYLRLGSTAALNAGIRLNANGGVYEMSGALGNLFKGSIAAITTVESKKLLVTEGV